MRYVADLPTVTSYFPIETKPSQVSTHSRFDLLKLLLIAGVLVIAIGTLQAQAPSDFSIIVLPDAQNESQYYPNVLASQTAWVVQNRAALNIQVFLGLGDLVNDGASDIQDGNADAAIRTLDIAGLPYFLRLVITTTTVLYLAMQPDSIAGSGPRGMRTIATTWETIRKAATKTSMVF